MKNFKVGLVLLCAIAGSSLKAQWSHDPASPKVVCNALNTQHEVFSSSDGNGGVFVVWVDRRDVVLTNADIYIQHLDQNGNTLWTSNGVPVCVASGFQGSPRVCGDGTGGAFVFWQDMRGGTFADIYGQYLNSSGIPQWPANGIGFRVLPSQTEVNSIRLIADGTGGAIVAWEDRRNGALNVDLYSQRVNNLGAALWATNGVAVSNAPNNQFNAQLATDMAGGAIFCWIDRRVDEDIYAQRIDATGNALWTVDGVAIGAANDFQRNPSMVSDMAGGAVIVFEDYRNGASERDIYAQRVDATGTVMWDPNGVIVCDQGGYQQQPKITHSIAGQYLVFWHDGRYGSSQEKVFIQRIDNSGMPYLLPNGVQGSPAPGDYFLRAITSSNGGGAIAHFSDESTNFYYVQKFDHNGNPVWPQPGVRYTTATTSDLPLITSDENGGCVLSMQIGGTGNENVHAQRIFSNGQHCANPPTVNLGTDITQCPGTVMLDAGNAGLSYLWSNAATTQSINVSTSGTYHVLVSDGGLGCYSRDTIVVQFHAQPTAFTGLDHLYCGDEETINSGNPGASSWLWSTGETTHAITVDQDATYSVTVTDGNGCTASHSVTIDFEPVPVVNLGGPQTTCGQTVVLDAGNPGATYIWSTGETTQTINATSGFYAVQVNLNGCNGNDNTTITNAAVTVNLGSDFAACGQATLDAGNAGATFSWDSGENTQTIVVTASGNYEVTVSNTAGCSATSDVDVTILEVPSAEIGPASMEVCDGDVLSFDIASTAGVLDYTISTAFQSANFSALVFTYDATMPPALVQCDVTGQNGCTSQDIVMLIDHSLYNLSWMITNANSPTFDLQAISIPATTVNWYWDFGDGTTGGPNSTFSHTFTANGSYDICLIALNECDSIAQCVNVNVTTIGVEENLGLRKDVEVYPTVSSGLFTLSSMRNEMPGWTILDITGREISSGTLNTGKQTIDIGFASGGVYFLRVHDGREAVIWKIVLQK